MPVPMSVLTLPAVERALSNLGHILDKGLAHAQANGLDADAWVESRLAPDMFPLAGQVQRASDACKALVARLADVDIPAMPDDETTYAQLQARVARTLAFVRSVDRSRLDGSERRTISFQAGKYPLSFTGLAYLMGFALPNLYFHVTTAYAILRHQGVPLGKLDYLGPVS